MFTIELYIIIVCYMFRLYMSHNWGEKSYKKSIRHTYPRKMQLHIKREQTFFGFKVERMWLWRYRSICNGLNQCGGITLRGFLDKMHSEDGTLRTGWKYLELCSDGEK